MRIFNELVFYLASISFDCQSFHRATYFYQQCLVVSEISRNFGLKCRTLMRLAKCAREFQLYEYSLEMLKKALCYAWVSNDSEQEIQLYDQLGMTYYYIGDIPQSEYYHRKWYLAETEPDNGYFRQTAAAFIKFYERELNYFSERIDKQFMVKLTLPILNVFEKTRCD